MVKEKARQQWLSTWSQYNNFTQLKLQNIQQEAPKRTKVNFCVNLPIPPKNP